MKRSSLLNLLEAYHPQDVDEQKAKEIIQLFVHANPDCFERTLEIGHITASSWLLNKEHTHALLMHHKKLNMWVMPGGHCDGDSDTLAVAIKEAQEESGIINIQAVSPAIFDIDVHIIPTTTKEKEHYHYDIRFLLHVTSKETTIQNDESNALLWINKDKQQLVTQERSVVRMFDKWCLL